MTENQEIAVSFLKLTASGKIQEAYDKYVAEDFIHHNAWFEGTREALKKSMEQSAKEKPNKVFEIKHIVSQGDYVVTHSFVKLDDLSPGLAVVHIVRLENGKIIEMWDVGQAIPVDSPNKNGPF